MFAHMKNIKFLSIVLLFFSFTAQADINILVEGLDAYVDSEACIAGGGKPNPRLHRKYVLCDGGKYNGMISGTNEATCESQTDVAKSLIDEKTGMAEDDAELLAAAASALGACIRQSEGFGKDLNKTLKDLKAQCLKYSDQRSELFTGTCYLKVADLAIHIM